MPYSSAVRLGVAALCFYLSSSPRASATPDIVSVDLPTLPAITAQGLPITQLGLFTFSVGTVLNPVNNDTGVDTVYNLQANASQQYSYQYYACAARGGGCSATPTRITQTQTAQVTSPLAFVSGKQATATFTFSYVGPLSLSLTAANASAADSYALSLADSLGQAVPLSGILNGAYTLTFTDQIYNRGSVYTITSTPDAATGGTGGSGVNGGSGSSGGAGTTGGSSSNGTTGNTTVFEPASSMLLVSALGILGLSRRRRSR